MSDLLVTGEVSNSKVVGVFASQSVARKAAAMLCSKLDLQPAQVKVISPESADVDIKLQPEGRGILRTIVLAHVWLGLFGALAGLGLFGVLMWLEVPFVVSSPWATALVTFSFGAVAGLLLGGLVSLRPDHDRYMHATRDAIADGQTTIVVHAFSSAQRSQASEILAGLGADVTATL